MIKKISVWFIFGIGLTAGFAVAGEDWQKNLTPQEYNILVKKGTEKPFTGDLLENKEKGLYVTAGCKQPVFHSDNKFDSKTGWPSFWKPYTEDAVKIEPDFKLFYRREEVLSSACGEHLGHVFKDGPEPTGLRYCINSAALDFIPEKDVPAFLESQKKP